MKEEMSPEQTHALSRMLARAPTPLDPSAFDAHELPPRKMYAHICLFDVRSEPVC